MTSSCSRAIGANAAHALTTFSRWFSAVKGCPLRSRHYRRERPPRALSAPQRCHEHGLDRVQSVLRLVEHHRGRRLEHLVGDLECAEAVLLVDLLADAGLGVVKGRQAM